MGKIPSEGCLILNSLQIFYIFICRITTKLTIVQFIWSLCGLVKKIGNLTDKNINGNNLRI